MSMLSYSGVESKYEHTIGIFLPSFGKVGPIAHHSLRQTNFCRIIIPGFIERITKNKGDFISMEDSCPCRPWIIRGSLIEIIKVYIVACLSIAMGKIYNWTSKGVVTNHSIQSIAIFQRISGLKPISVFVNYCLKNSKKKVTNQSK